MCFILAISGTNGLNGAGVPLSNKQTKNVIDIHTFR